MLYTVLYTHTFVQTDLWIFHKWVQHVDRDKMLPHCSLLGSCISVFNKLEAFKLYRRLIALTTHFNQDYYGTHLDASAFFASCSSSSTAALHMTMTCLLMGAVIHTWCFITHSIKRHNLTIYVVYILNSPCHIGR